MSTATPTDVRNLTIADPSIARTLLRTIEWRASHYLAEVPVMIVGETHWLARHAHADEDVVLHQGREDDAWRSMAEFERLNDRSPRMLVVVTS
jgi:hypothetical protein